MERHGDWWYEAGPIDSSDREFDIDFWQAQGPSAILAAAWQLVETATLLKGGSANELRLQRTPIIVEPIWH